MRDLGITGAVRGKKVITTLPRGQAERAPDRLERDFVAKTPNRCWVADYPREDLGRCFLHRLRRGHLLPPDRRLVRGHREGDGLRPGRCGDGDLAARPRPTPRPTRRVDPSLGRRVAQYTSFRFAEHLDAASIAASIGSVGDAYDNALMESTIGLFKTELIKPRRPWKTFRGRTRHR